MASLWVWCRATIVLAEALGEGRVVALATALQSDISALCAKSDTAYERPRHLSGARYGSCGYPLEVAAINSMIFQDGGSRGVEEVCPPMRTQTEELLIEGHVDCAWLYRPWEVLRAKRQGVQMHELVPAEWGVPFGYMNLLAARRADVAQELAGPTSSSCAAAARDSRECSRECGYAGVLTRMLRAVTRGGMRVADDPEAAARLLAGCSCGAGCGEGGGGGGGGGEGGGGGRRCSGYGDDLADEKFNLESLRALLALGAFAPYDPSAAADTWTHMDPARWEVTFFSFFFLFCFKRSSFSRVSLLFSACGRGAMVM